MGVEQSVDQLLRTAAGQQYGPRVLLHELGNSRKLVADAARIGQHSDELAFVVGDTKLAQRSAASPDEDDEVGAVNVVRLAAHQSRSGKDHRRVRLQRGSVDVDVFFP